MNTSTPTRRERALARLERRREWAAGRRQKSDAAFDAVHRLADSIPFGQPILVGHHSERHARRDCERIDNGMRRACESVTMAAHHESKADGIERQLETTIFSDDPDAIEAIRAKVAAGHAQLAEWKVANSAWRKSGVAGLVALGWPQARADAAAVAIAAAYSWEKQPFVKWQISNLGANLRRLEKRIEHIESMQRQHETAQAAPGGLAIVGADYVSVTFAEKPAREILEALRAAGFCWGSGSWSGYREKLPALVLELIEENAGGEI